jgi:hypothetical protein
MLIWVTEFSSADKATKTYRITKTQLLMDLEDM